MYKDKGYSLFAFQPVQSSSAASSPHPLTKFYPTVTQVNSESPFYSNKTLSVEEKVKPIVCALVLLIDRYHKTFGRFIPLQSSDLVYKKPLVEGDDKNVYKARLWLVSWSRVLEERKFLSSGSKDKDKDKNSTADKKFSSGFKDSLLMSSAFTAMHDVVVNLWEDKEYLPPEVVEEEDQLSLSISWWSLGVITYFLLSGSTPFSDPNVPVMYRKIAEVALMLNTAKADAQNWIF